VLEREFLRDPVTGLNTWPKLLYVFHTAGDTSDQADDDPTPPTAVGVMFSGSAASLP